MAVTSWRACASAVSNTKIGATISWVNPSNIYSSNNVYSTATMAQEKTHWLWCLNFGFTSSDIPNGATITGLEIRWERNAVDGLDLGGNVETYFQAIVSSSLVGTMKTNTSPDTIGSSDATETKGGDLDTWGTTFTQANAIASDTGIAIARDSAGLTTEVLSVDIVEMRWYYSTFSPNQGSFFGLLT